MIDRPWRDVAKNAGTIAPPLHPIAGSSNTMVPQPNGNVLVLIAGQPAGIYPNEERAAAGIDVLQRIGVGERRAS